MLKRIISLIATTFIAIQTLTVFAFAETNAGDSYYYLTISDANGNIVADVKIHQPKQNYGELKFNEYEK